jgi:uncharacterized membrane protein
MVLATMVILVRLEVLRHLVVVVVVLTVLLVQMAAVAAAAVFPILAAVPAPRVEMAGQVPGMEEEEEEDLLVMVRTEVMEVINMQVMVEMVHLRQFLGLMFYIVAAAVDHQ